ncbi:MAG: hypothetical protein R3E01_26040 [Pirellulaceae bacterium]|nr:hypothetical protein [Planctomycetales bacterium]
MIAPPNPHHTLLLAANDSRTYYDVTRIASLNQWWHWLVLVAACLTILLYVTTLYRRDSHELPRGIAWLLYLLRLFAFLGLLVFFLNIERRTEQSVTKNSRLVTLIDTSQSMGLVDAVSLQEGANGRSRLEQVVDTLRDSSLMADLRRKHDVVVYRFDQGERPQELALLEKTEVVRDASVDQTEVVNQTLSESRWLYGIAATLLGCAATALVLHWLLGVIVRNADGQSWAVFAAGLLAIFALVTGAVANLRYPTVTFANLVGREAWTPDRQPSATDGEDTDSSEMKPGTGTDWLGELQPQGTETRLTGALQYVIEHERGGPIAGIVLVTDGNGNPLVDVTDVTSLARDASIPIYTVGMGTDEHPRNIRVVDVEAPPRVFPGDEFTITAYLQSFGMEGTASKVELLVDDAGNADSSNRDPSDTDSSESRGASATGSTDANGASTGSDNVAGDERPGEATGLLLEELRMTAGTDGSVETLQFQTTPRAVGRHRYRLRVTPASQELDSSDNIMSATVEVVDRQNKVLLLAGGPTREYRFVRNLLFRDASVTSHVWLQGAALGIAQEADEILADFPELPEELFEYDAIVAFDPDWTQLNDRQAKLLERWVAEKAGGLILIAGPVYTPEWTMRRRVSGAVSTVKDLYPVVFYSGASITFGRGQLGSETAWPVQFTDEGRQSRFLWLDDSELKSEQDWAAFNGVYGYQPIQGAKDGATVYARFSNPETSIDGELPIYMAGQYYGAGYVFYMGSGEMWRLRELGDEYLERFYTSLIRYVSQGRLLRDSSRGVLLVSKDRCLLGETIAIRATLSDERFNPLELDEVEAELIHPNDRRNPLVLKRLRDAPAAGMYAGQFTATEEGEYRIQLAVPLSNDLELLRRQVRVRLPDREIERPQRNDATMSSLAKETGGRYYVGMQAAISNAAQPSLAAVSTPQDQTSYLPGIVDRVFERLLMTWLLAAIVGALAVEWLVRRLNKLA